MLSVFKSFVLFYSSRLILALDLVDAAIHSSGHEFEAKTWLKMKAKGTANWSWYLATMSGAISPGTCDLGFLQLLSLAATSCSWMEYSKSIPIFPSFRDGFYYTIYIVVTRTNS